MPGVWLSPPEPRPRRRGAPQPPRRGSGGAGLCPPGPKEPGGAAFSPRPPGGAGDRTRLFPFIFLPFPPAFSFFPRSPRSRRAPAAIFRVANFEDARPGRTDGEAGKRLLGLFKKMLVLFVCFSGFFFFLVWVIFFRSQHGPRERTARGRRGTRGSGPRTAAAAGTGERGHCAPSSGARTERRSGGGEGPGLGCAGVVPQSCRRGAAV